MDKQAIFSHYSQILDELINSYKFFQNYFQTPYSLVNDTGAIFCGDTICRLKFGVSKGCIVSKNCDFVVKFDLENSDTGDFFDLCSHEEELFAEACAHNLNQYLTKCEYIGTFRKEIIALDSDVLAYNYGRYNYESFDEEGFCDFVEKNCGDLEKCKCVISVPLYAYPKIESTFLFGSSPYVSLEESKKYRALYEHSPLGERSASIAVEFIREYGEDEFEKFSKFCKDFSINDLHTGNCGYINKHLVFYDYSGFHSDDSYYSSYY